MAEAIETSPLTDVHFRAIGRIVVEWAMAEQIIMTALWEVATQQSMGDLTEETGVSLALVHGMEPRVAVGLLKAVFGTRHPAEAVALNKIAEGLTDSLKVRNIVAHGRWGKGSRPGTVETFTYSSAGGFLRAETHGFTVVELNAAADRINARTAGLVVLLLENGYMKGLLDLPRSP